MQDSIKSKRMFIDHLLIETKTLSTNREMALAYTHLQRGTMWLGKVLGDLGASNPYPESTNSKSDKIEERTDQAKDSPSTYEGMNRDSRTASVKWLREQIAHLVSVLKEDRGRIHIHSESNAINVALDALEESKMWFGQELNNIRLSGN